MSIYSTDSVLVQSIREQDEKAINYLYKTVGPLVKNYIINKGGSTVEADDVFQEGIIACYLNIQSGKYTMTNDIKFTTYLTQICKYKWYDHLKNNNTKASNNEIPEVTDENNILMTLEEAERNKAIHVIIDELGELCKSILNGFYWEKQSTAELGGLLNMTAASVKNAKYRCMQKLKGKVANVTQLK